MAIHLCSENSGTGATTTTTTMSPRISFSYDLSHSDTLPVEQLLRSFSSSSTVDFNFCVQQNPNHHQASMADELFSDGKIIPTPIKQHPPPPQPPQSPPLIPNPPPIIEEEEIQNSSKSFWGFKRSSSCGNGNGYARSLCPIPLLSRSNSTGSASSSTKRSSNSSSNSNSKEGFTQKHHNHNHNHNHNQNNLHHNFQKPPLRKTSYRYGNHTSGNGSRVNPVLNLGFGSFFSTSKKKMKS